VDNVLTWVSPEPARSNVASALKELFRYRQLLVSLTWRDVRVRYKQSILGFAWALLVPVCMMAVFTVVLGGHVGPTIDGARPVPYPLYVLSGLLPWMFFSSAINGCVNSLVANRNLVTKVYFPREVFPLSCIGSALVDLLLGATALVGLLAWYAANGTWGFQMSAALMFVPVLLVVQIALTAGLGMLLAMGNLFYRDVRQMTSVLLPLWMFISGVVIPPPARETWSGWLLAWNPLTPLIENYRRCVLHGSAPNTGELMYVSLAAAVLLAGGWLVFQRSAPRFAECI